VEVDWFDRASVIEYVVDYSQALAGGRRPFAEAEVRELATRNVERARDVAAAMRGCSHWREPVTGSFSPTGRLSAQRSSITPEQLRRGAEISRSDAASLPVEQPVPLALSDDRSFRCTGYCSGAR